MSHVVLHQISDSDHKRRRCEQNHGGFIPFHEGLGWVDSLGSAARASGLHVF